MNRRHLESNLSEQCNKLRAHKGAHLAAPSNLAAHLSWKLFLAHSTDAAAFASVCGGMGLYSREELARNGGRALRADDRDVLNGTAGCVFLYAAPFRYPDTTCGFLFRPSLESERREDGSASAFDSGGLGGAIQFPAGFSSTRTFLEAHSLPIPEHREYLCLTMDNLFADPKHYLDGTPRTDDGCLGLSGGDCRMWTHEVRVPRFVPLRGVHLQAVFAPQSVVSGSRAVEDLFAWCDQEGVDTIAIPNSGDGDFDILRRHCISYVEQELY